MDFMERLEMKRAQEYENDMETIFAIDMTLIILIALIAVLKDIL